MFSDKEALGPCPLCGRVMMIGPTIDRHHLVPQAKGGKHKGTELCHVVCHRKVHSTLCEGELSSFYFTWERLREHPHIKRFIKWVQKKDPEYIDSHLDTKERRRSR